MTKGRIEHVVRGLINIGSTKVYVTCGVFSTLRRANNFAEKVREQGLRSAVTKGGGGGKVYSVGTITIESLELDSTSLNRWELARCAIL